MQESQSRVMQPGGAVNVHNVVFLKQFRYFAHNIISDIMLTLCHIKFTRSEEQELGGRQKEILVRGCDHTA
jgi:hypothetical protein